MLLSTGTPMHLLVPTC